MTTLGLMVPFFTWTQAEPILVTKLNRASDPTARRGGTRSTKIRMGNSRTPPPMPVIPIRVPTTKPIRIFSINITSVASGGENELHPLGAVAVHSNEPLAFHVQNDLLCCLLRTEIGRVDHHIGVLRFFVGIGDAGELFENPSARLSVRPLRSRCSQVST